MENLNENFEEEFVPEEDVEVSSGLIKKLREKLKKAEKEKQEYLDGWQRSKADYINSQKQNEKEKESFIKFANQKLISEILPSIDNLESALSTESNQNSDSEWRKGIENIYKELKKTLSRNDIEEINPEILSEFDPNLHEAVSMEPVEKEGEDHKIISVLQKGYKLNDRVVRAAKVKVGQFLGS